MKCKAFIAWTLIHYQQKAANIQSEHWQLLSIGMGV
jgi:hypothetical protein